ncbi:hypothetical protein PIB30_025558 [Stylosanthes scabra]|uniref:Uncharacterized protein n=1 Tax=Stylosanthes scabra TaxID=79078 RepID=A0ABU6Q9K5_9FABA|nr:hypothetical protein [Stylosanthes scabra]
MMKIKLLLGFLVGIVFSFCFVILHSLVDSRDPKERVGIQDHHEHPQVEIDVASLKASGENHAITAAAAAKYGIQAEIEHYSCMVDLYRRAGQFDKAERLIKTTPFEHDVVLWGALLAACGLHSNIELGEYAAERIRKLESNHPVSFSMLSKIQGEKGTWSMEHGACIIRSTLILHRQCRSLIIILTAGYQLGSSLIVPCSSPAARLPASAHRLPTTSSSRAATVVSRLVEG